MPKNGAIFLALCLFLVACTQKEKTQNAEYHIDSLEVVQVKPVATPNDCLFDSIEFTNRMGRGVLELRLKSYNFRGDSLIFNKNDSQFIMRLIDNKGWQLTVNNKPSQQFIRYFLPSDFGSHFRFIYSGGPKTRPYIQSYGSNSIYELAEGSSFSVFLWNEYLMHQSVATIGNLPFFKEPNCYLQPIDSIPTGYYSVVDTNKHWIQLAYINSKDVEGKLPQDTLGWIQWYCDSTFRIQILNDIYMEDYFNR